MMVQAVTSPPWTAVQVATALGIAATLFLLAGNLLLVGMAYGKLVKGQQSHADDIDKLGALGEKLGALIMDHESRISTIEGAEGAKYGRRKEDREQTV